VKRPNSSMSALVPRSGGCNAFAATGLASPRREYFTLGEARAADLRFIRERPDFTLDEIVLASGARSARRAPRKRAQVASTAGQLAGALRGLDLPLQKDDRPLRVVDPTDGLIAQETRRQRHGRNLAPVHGLHLSVELAQGIHHHLAERWLDGFPVDRAQGRSIGQTSRQAQRGSRLPRAIASRSGPSGSAKPHSSVKSQPFNV
jgi:hypothetical protein